MRVTDDSKGIDELTAPAPTQNPDTDSSADTVQNHIRKEEEEEQEEQEDDDDDSQDGIDELDAPAPEQNPEEVGVFRHSSLEQRAAEESAHLHQEEQQHHWRAELPRHAVIHCHLIFFSILGVLARIGLQALTTYPGAPVPNTDLWANVAGCLIIGFLREDRALYRWHWAQINEKQSGDADKASNDVEAQRKQDLSSAKASIPSYLGLTVGFCGSFTSFASICRDSYFAISNTLNTAAISEHVVSSTLRPRPAGDSVMALLAILIEEVGLSLGALRVGAHLAVLTEHLTKEVQMVETQRYFNAFIVVVGPLIWLGSVILAIWPPYEAWRGQVVFALVLAPLGCIARFQLARQLNRLIKTFPMGTFTANVLGTCVLGMAYDLQHSDVTTSIVGAQVLQGVIDGFCGALTTVSTWVLELDTLRLRHAYLYGVCSLSAAIAALAVIMGSLQWSVGFKDVPQI